MEYMVNAHCADALVCYFQLRQDHPRHADGRLAPQRAGRVRLGRAPMEAGKVLVKGEMRALDPGGCHGGGRR